MMDEIVKKIKEALDIHVDEKTCIGDEELNMVTLVRRYYNDGFEKKFEDLSLDMYVSLCGTKNVYGYDTLYEYDISDLFHLQDGQATTFVPMAGRCRVPLCTIQRPSILATIILSEDQEDRPPLELVLLSVCSFPPVFFPLCKVKDLSLHHSRNLANLRDRLTDAMALLPLSFYKRYIPSCETPTPSSSHPLMSPALPSQKRYQGTSELIADTDSEDFEDESTDLESEEAHLRIGSRQSSRSVHDQQVADPTPRLSVRPTCVDPKDHTLYLDIEFDLLSLAPVHTPASPERSFGSPASLSVPSPVALPVTTSAATIAVHEDKFIEVGAQLELHGSILQDHTRHLDAFPPTLLEGMGWDITDLYNRSAAVRGEIHSQRFRLGSLKQGQEQANIIFGSLWRSVLALEAWAGETDTQRAALWQARYKDHRLIHDLLVQNATTQRQLQELRDRVTTLEQEKSHRGE
uniref:Protein kinase-like domain-containing protein n=1 Tax=Tanacetum cinerariifolium TaxID=118510 RepID=A0A6L2P1N4_TANCI|nr:protein kinase-like domain-containing protein [Tanacetum cinerariifolium]